MRRIGMPEEEIHDALQLRNVSACDPPLDPSEVRAIASSIAKYPPGLDKDSTADKIRGILGQDLGN